jgi:hypothetical protein
MHPESISPPALPTKSREPAPVFAAAGSGWGARLSWEETAVGRRLALADTEQATKADSPGRGFDDSSIYPSCALDMAEHGVFERGGCRFA